MKKHIFFLTALVAATGLMTSCSDDDMLSGASNTSSIDSNSIVFSTNNAKSPTTRSGATINSINEFTVNAVDEMNTSYFSDVQFTYDNASAVFKSSINYYWPVSGSLSFYAISNTGEKNLDPENVPTYSYSDWSGETDLVAATVKTGNKTIPYPLLFHHITSQVYISAEAANKTEELTYRLTGVKMAAPCNGTYSFDKVSGGAGLWEVDNSSSKIYSFEEALPLSFGQNSAVSPKSVYWNILPVREGNLEFDIEYQVIQNGKVIADFTNANAKHVTVNKALLAAGKKHQFNFILPIGTNDVITFTSSVLDWEDGSESDVNVKFQSAANENPELTWVLYNDGSFRSYDLSGTITGNINANYGNTTVIGNTKNITSIIFGNKVTSIEECAFTKCENITSVYFPSSVKSIGHLAFSCSSIRNLVLPEGLTTLGEAAFAESKVKTVSIPKTLLSVGRGSFSNCTELEQVIIDEGVTKIEHYAFSGDHQLKAVYIPSTVTEIGDEVFYHCGNLEILYVDKNNPAFYADETGLFSKDMTTLYYGMAQPNKTYFLPNTLTTIVKGAYKDNPNLTSIHFPNSLTDIGDSAFEFCYGLTEVSIPENVSIGSFAFGNCNNVETVTIGAGCTLYTNCFRQNFSSREPYKYSRLKTVAINGKVKLKGYAMFWGCVNLNTIKYNSTEQPDYDEIGATYNAWSSTSATNCVGYNTRSTGNVFYIPANATYSENELDKEKNILFNTEFSGFTLSRSL